MPEIQLAVEVRRHAIALLKQGRFTEACECVYLRAPGRPLTEIYTFVWSLEREALAEQAAQWDKETNGQ